MFRNRSKTPIPESVTERVSMGVALLDEKKPDWWRTIGRNTINIADPYRCALGYTYGRYHDGRAALEMKERDAIAYGFQARAFSLDRYAEFDALTVEWRRVIDERLDEERERWRREFMTATKRRAWWF